MTVVSSAVKQIQLAPDLEYFKTKTSFQSYTEINGINGTAGYATALSLSGKFLIAELALRNLTSNDLRYIRLTIDGVVIWENATAITTNSTSEPLIGDSIPDWIEGVVCNFSLLLEVQTAVDNDITCRYIARPIL